MNTKTVELIGGPLDGMTIPVREDAEIACVPAVGAFWESPSILRCEYVISGTRATLVRCETAMEYRRRISK